ncbi:MAG: HU family DNA-binding protein [Balneolaceae bacterium]|nr:HU family DNA-binding protein [Balneolaceae bacterium]MBO6545439.1 HU family DNA-binding protein [Balneolaceae bacterium]MBO6646835.1 HU family DNA-binding protein [Balneolaceae bacterium]
MSDKVTFSKLVEELAEKTGTTQTLSHDFVSSLTGIVINSAMESGKSSITNFGSFSVVDVAARNGVNPRTGESIVIPAHQRLSFSPYKALESTVNAPFAHLEATVIQDDDENDSPTQPETTTKPLAPLPFGEDSEEGEADKKMDDPESSDQEEKTETPVFKRPGKEEEKSGNLQNVLILIVVFLLVILGLWYFVFRDTSKPQVAEQTPPPPIETPADPTPNPPPAVDQTATDSDTPEESQIIDEEAPEPEQVEIVEENVPSNYVVSSGEWIYDIARRNYNQPTFWPLIFEANFSPDQDPDLIIPGKELKIPEIADAQNLTQNDRERLASALRLVSEAYANAGKSDQAENYRRMAAKFSN